MKTSTQENLYPLSFPKSLGREKEYKKTSSERNIVTYGLYHHPEKELVQNDLQKLL